MSEIEFLYALSMELLLLTQALRSRLHEAGLFSGRLTQAEQKNYEFERSWLLRLESARGRIVKRMDELKR